MNIFSPIRSTVLRQKKHVEVTNNSISVFHKLKQHLVDNVLYIISFVVPYRLSVTYKKELKENMIVIINQLNIHFNTIR